MFGWHHHSLPITQYFSHYLWVPYLSLVQFFFFFSLVPRLIEPSGKKNRTARPNQTEPVKKKKKKKPRPNSQPRRKKKKKTKAALVTGMGPTNSVKNIE